MSKSPTARKIEAAHKSLAESAGVLAIALEKGRGVSRSELREIVQTVRRAADTLEEIAGT